jgi:DNA-binding XRE family transcriptional regulator
MTPMTEERRHDGKTCPVGTHDRLLEVGDGAAAPCQLGASDRPSMGRPRRSRQRTLMLRLLVQLRDDAGLDQTSLARRLDITQSEVSKYERGERNLDVLRLREWLHALEVEFPAFVTALDQELKRQDAAFAAT